MQNRFNLADRAAEPVLDRCEELGIAFIPWFPLAAGELAEPGGAAAEIAAAHDASPGQIALAWLLRRSPVMIPIPGTSSIEHLEENLEAAEIELSDDGRRWEGRATELFSEGVRSSADLWADGRRVLAARLPPRVADRQNHPRCAIR